MAGGDVVRIPPSTLCSGGFGSSSFECSRDIGAGVVGVGGEGLRIVDEAEDPVFDDEAGVGEGGGVLGREGEGVGGDEGGEFGFAVFAVGGEEGREIGDEGGYIPGCRVNKCLLVVMGRKGFLPADGRTESRRVGLVTDIGEDQVRVDGDGPWVASEVGDLLFPSRSVALELVADC